MRKAESSKRPENYMPLTEMEQTFYLYEEKMHNVQTSDALLFDIWVEQFVKVSGVDREEWEIYQRWQVINFLLEHTVLLILPQDDETFLLQPVLNSEEKSSESPSAMEEKSVSA